MRTVSILGKPWTIRYVNEDELGGELGDCLEPRLAIRVSTAQAEEQQQDTTLHELIHAISFELDLKLSERSTRLLATGLRAMLIDNPALVAYLTNGEK